MTDVHFLVLPGTMLLDFAGTAESFRVAAEFGAQLRLHYVGPSDLPLSSLGLALAGVSPLPERLAEGAIVVVPGVMKSAKDLSVATIRSDIVSEDRATQGDDRFRAGK